MLLKGKTANRPKPERRDQTPRFPDGVTSVMDRLLEPTAATGHSCCGKTRKTSWSSSGSAKDGKGRFYFELTGDSIGEVLL